jgi:hypothetical protein
VASQSPMYRVRVRAWSCACAWRGVRWTVNCTLANRQYILFVVWCCADQWGARESAQVWGRIRYLKQPGRVSWPSVPETFKCVGTHVFLQHARGCPLEACTTG